MCVGGKKLNHKRSVEPAVQFPHPISSPSESSTPALAATATRNPTEHRAMYETNDFASYARLADELILKASKEQLADVTRLLALNIGWYHQRYGDVPQDQLLYMVRADALTDETKTLVLHGMQNLVSALAEVLGMTLDGGEQARH